MEISFKLQSFEGPLDLLLHLIEKNKVSIYDIPIAMITDQYLEYVRGMDGQDLDVMSEFLVMASTLLDIKSRMLLPAVKNEEGEEIDPREELVQRLLDYKLYKYMSGTLRECEEDGGKVMYRDQDVPGEVLSYRPKVDPEELLGDVTLGQLHAIFSDIMKRTADRMDPIRSSFGTIEREEVNTGAIMHEVEEHILKKKKCTFRSLLTRKKGKMYVVVTFLTILELMKMGRVDARQEDMFGEIYITARDESEWEAADLDSEWLEES
jgi:segregation and condensation protein A